MIDGPQPTRLEIADSLRQVVDQVDSARDACGGDFLPDSPAANDWCSNEVHGDWGPQPLQDAYRTAELYGASVRDHVLALADLIERSRPFAMATLARALTEPAARAVWLLEPDTPPLERVRRLLNDILFAAHEHETLWADEPGVPGTSNIYSRVEDEAVGRGLTFSSPVRDPQRRRYAAAHIGTPRPSSQWLLGHTTKNPATAKFFYRSGSAVLHGALHGYDQRLTYSEQSPKRANVADVDADAVLRDCTFAMQVYVTYVGALMYQTMWPDDRVLVAVDALEEVWQRIAEPPPTPAS